LTRGYTLVGMAMLHKLERIAL